MSCATYSSNMQRAGACLMRISHANIGDAMINVFGLHCRWKMGKQMICSGQVGNLLLCIVWLPMLVSGQL